MQRLTARQGGTILGKVDLQIRQGHTYAIASPLGAGKTTLLRLLVMITHRPSVTAKADYVIHLAGDGTVRMNSSQS